MKFCLMNTPYEILVQSALRLFSVSEKKDIKIQSMYVVVQNEWPWMKVNIQFDQLTLYH